MDIPAAVVDIVNCTTSNQLRIAGFARTQIARSSFIFTSTTTAPHYVSALVAAIVIALLIHCSSGTCPLK
jgi:hypothetical protein